MSILVKESYVNPSTPLWESNGPNLPRAIISNILAPVAGINYTQAITTIQNIPYTNPKRTTYQITAIFTAQSSAINGNAATMSVGVGGQSLVLSGIVNSGLFGSTHVLSGIIILEATPNPINFTTTISAAFPGGINTLTNVSLTVIEYPM